MHVPPVPVRAPEPGRCAACLGVQPSLPSPREMGETGFLHPSPRCSVSVGVREDLARSFPSPAAGGATAGRQGRVTGKTRPTRRPAAGPAAPQQPCGLGQLTQHGWSSVSSSEHRQVRQCCLKALKEHVRSGLNIHNSDTVPRSGELSHCHLPSKATSSGASLPPERVAFPVSTTGGGAGTPWQLALWGPTADIQGLSPVPSSPQWSHRTGQDRAAAPECTPGLGSASSAGSFLGLSASISPDPRGTRKGTGTSAKPKPYKEQGCAALSGVQAGVVARSPGERDPRDKALPSTHRLPLLQSCRAWDRRH